MKNEDPSSGPSVQDKRWYDKKPTVKKAFTQLCDFQDDLLTVLASKVCMMVESRYEANNLLASLKSLGTERVLAIYKSKSKLRKLDENQQMHLVVNYFFVMRPDHQNKAAGDTLEMVAIANDYLTVCEKFEYKPSKTHVETLADTYVRSGEIPARELLAGISDQIKKTSEKISFEGGDMRIRGN